MSWKEDKELKEKLLEHVSEYVPKGRRSKSVEEAFEKALGFVKEEESTDHITEDEWL